MSKSKAQKFAQKRNSAGGLLKGIIKNLNKNIDHVCCQVEKDKLAAATHQLEDLYKCWSDNYEQAKSEYL